MQVVAGENTKFFMAFFAMTTDDGGGVIDCSDMDEGENISRLLLRLCRVETGVLHFFSGVFTMGVFVVEGLPKTLELTF